MERGQWICYTYHDEYGTRPFFLFTHDCLLLQGKDFQEVDSQLQGSPHVGRANREANRGNKLGLGAQSQHLIYIETAIKSIYIISSKRIMLPLYLLYPYTLRITWK